MNVSTEFNGILENSSSYPWSIVFIVFGLFGIIDNGLVLVVMGSAKDLRDATNLLIANQSLIDLMTSILLLILTIEPGVLRLDRPDFAQFVCVFWMSWYPFWATITASSINLLIITYERFCAIVYPIRYRQRMTTKRVALMSVIPWVYGFCASSSNIIFAGVDGNKCLIVWYPNKDFQKGVAFLLFSLHFVGLIFTISVLYIIIALNLRGGLGEKTKVVNFRERARRNVLRTMFIVFACYIICWAPHDIYLLNHTLNEGVKLQGILYDVTILMAFGNVWINPVIYSFRYERFQKALKRLFCFKGRRQERPNISISLKLQASPSLQSIDQPEGMA